MQTDIMGEETTDVANVKKNLFSRFEMFGVDSAATRDTSVVRRTDT